jgi:hypothetical protein
MMSYIILAAIFLITVVVLVIARRKMPIPKAWITFMTASTILAFIGIWHPLRMPWLIFAIIVWLLTGITIFLIRRSNPILSLVLTVAMVGAMIATGFIRPIPVQKPVIENPTPTPSPTQILTPTVSPTLTIVHTTWKMKEGDYSKNRWFSEGVIEIQKAKTDAQAADAAEAWINRVKTDPNLLIGAVKFYLKTDVQKTEIVTNDSWATDKAVQLATQLQLVFSQSRIEPDQAPADGYNSGVDNNKVVGASVAGITKDRTAIKVTTADGQRTWIMSRCGNVVTPNKPPVPPGKTDEKSSDPKDYRKPGDNTKPDAGTGLKPGIPAPTKPVDSAPPVVITGTGKIHDEIVDSSSATSRDILTTEPHANPTGGSNSGDPGSPP